MKKIEKQLKSIAPQAICKACFRPKYVIRPAKTKAIDENKPKIPKRTIHVT